MSNLEFYDVLDREMNKKGLSTVLENQFNNYDSYYIDAVNSKVIFYKEKRKEAILELNDDNDFIFTQDIDDISSSVTIIGIDDETKCPYLLDCKISKSQWLGGLMFKEEEKNYDLNGKECNSKIKYYGFNKKQLAEISEEKDLISMTPSELCSSEFGLLLYEKAQEKKINPLYLNEEEKIGSVIIKRKVKKVS